MSDLKFNCPSCGQHIQCDESHAGENLPCPGCAHLIRVPNNAEIVRETPPAAPTVGAGIAEVPTLEDNFLAESGTPLPAPPPMTEREAQLAAAKAASEHKKKVIKPRLSFILSGGQAPAREENEHALEEPPKGEPHKEDPHSESDHKTLHE